MKFLIACSSYNLFDNTAVFAMAMAMHRSAIFQTPPKAEDLL